MKQMLKSFCTWCLRTIWPKAKAISKRTWTIATNSSKTVTKGIKKACVWSKPYLQTVWGKIKSGAKWTWNHKTEKKVWISAIVFAVLTLLILGIGLVMHTLKAIVSGDWHMTWLTWVSLAMLGLAMVPLEAIVWVLVWQGTAKTKTVLKIHAWIAVIVGVPTALFILWVLIKKGTGNIVSWYTTNVPYHGWVLIGAIIAIGLVVWKIWGPKPPPPSTTPSPAGLGQNGGKGLRILGWICAMGILWGMGYWMLNKEMAEGRGELRRVAAPQQTADRSFKIFAGQNPTPVFVQQGVNICWTVEGSGHILFRFNDGPEQEDWAEQQLRLPNCNVDRTFYIRSKGADTVPVRIYLTRS